MSRITPDHWLKVWYPAELTGERTWAEGFFGGVIYDARVDDIRVVLVAPDQTSWEVSLKGILSIEITSPPEGWEFC